MDSFLTVVLDIFSTISDSLRLHPRRPRPLPGLSHALMEKLLDLVQRVHGLLEDPGGLRCLVQLSVILADVGDDLGDEILNLLPYRLFGTRQLVRDLTVTEYRLHAVGHDLLYSCKMCEKGTPAPKRRFLFSCEAYQLLVALSTNRSAPYRSRSLGFSILPVGLRGTSAKMILRGRL